MVSMRPSVFVGVLVAGLAVVPSALFSQDPYVWVMPRVEEEAPSATSPFSLLLAHGDELGLGSRQIGRIESVRSELIDKNEPLLAQIRDAEVMGVETDEERNKLEAVRNSFDENVSEAEQAVREILTAEQCEQVDAILGEDWAYPSEVESAEVENDGEALGRDRRRAEVTLTVENHNFLDANIYVIAGTRRQRLGFVTGLDTETFRIPEAYVVAASGMRFEVQQIPRNRLPQTPEIVAFPGDRVFLRVPPTGNW